MTRSKKAIEESTCATYTILKNAPAYPAVDESKENVKIRSTPPKQSPPEPKAVSPYNIVPRGPLQLPCEQYKTEKGYKCPNCQRCYNARKNLVRHVTLECGRDPQYKCPHCSYSKHRRNELKKHLEKKHSELYRDRIAAARAHAPSPASPAMSG